MQGALTHAQKQALFNHDSKSLSVKGLPGKWTPCLVRAPEFHQRRHWTLKVAGADDVARSWSLSKVILGLEFLLQCRVTYTKI